MPGDGQPLAPPPENYAQHWCSLLTDPAGAFSPCHSTVDPAPFHMVRPLTCRGVPSAHLELPPPRLPWGLPLSRTTRGA